MKKVKITYDSITITKSNYKVWLGDYNEYGDPKYYYFSSQKKAENFVKKTNKFLTDKLHELNTTLARVGYEYRVNWGVFSDEFISYRVERIINQHLQFTTDNINKIAQMSRANNKHINYYAIRGLKLSCEYLSKVVEELISLNQKRSATNLVYSYKFILNDLIRIEAALNNYEASSTLYVIRKEPVKKIVKPINSNNGGKYYKARAKFQFRDRHQPKEDNSISQTKANSSNNNGGSNLHTQSS